MDQVFSTNNNYLEKLLYDVENLRNNQDDKNSIQDICLDYAIYWGLLATFIIKYLHPFFNINIIKKIPNHITIIILIIFLIDTCLVFINKIMKN